MKKIIACVCALFAFLLVPVGPGFAAPDRVKVPEFTISGPFNYQNLSVFLIHGQDREGTPEYMPLTRALEEKKAKVYETGDVGRLAVENLSKDTWIMVHTGDIVRGGRQDRMLRFDMLLPPKSGKVPLDSFCVESGRWSGRGGESAQVFAAAPKMAPSKEMKIAARKEANQGKVWSSVAEQQDGLNKNLRRMKGDESLDVRSEKSATSLALALENKEVEKTVADYVAAIEPAAKGKKDVLGFAFAVNGCLNSAEVYATHGIFAAFWPRLLEAASTEALSQYEPGVKNRCTTTAEQVRDLLRFRDISSIMPLERKELSKDTRVFVWEHGPYLMYETVRPGGENIWEPWVHRSYLWQEGKSVPDASLPKAVRRQQPGGPGVPQVVSPSAEVRQER